MVQHIEFNFASRDTAMFLVLFLVLRTKYEWPCDIKLDYFSDQ